MGERVRAYALKGKINFTPKTDQVGKERLQHETGPFLLGLFMLYSGFWNLFCKIQEITVGISLTIAGIDRCIPPMVVYCPTWIPTLLPLLSHSCSTTR
jgi:hypothetical protein